MRFEREAKLPASLRHPNILYGLEIHADQPFLVVELPLFEQLADR